MKKLSEKQRDFLNLGKKMKEILELSNGLTLKGDPVISEWMKELHDIVQKYKVAHMLKNIWQYESIPMKCYLFDTLIDLRRILKDEGVFSDDLVE